MIGNRFLITVVKSFGILDILFENRPGIVFIFNNYKLIEQKLHSLIIANIFLES